MPDFATRLTRLGLSQAEFRRFVKHATGRELARSTTARWITGQHRPDPVADALLAVIARPALLNKISRKENDDATSSNRQRTQNRALANRIHTRPGGPS